MNIIDPQQALDEGYCVKVGSIGNLYAIARNETNSKGYSYILVSPTKEQDFLSAMNDDEPFMANKYGKIIEQGSGTPSKEVQDRIIQFYEKNCDKG